MGSCVNIEDFRRRARRRLPRMVFDYLEGVQQASEVLHATVKHFPGIFSKHVV